MKEGGVRAGELEVGPPTASFQLELLGGGAVISRHPLSARPFHIGRGPTNDLILLDDAASSRHARVWIEGGRPRVADAGSRNGTWVNGERIAAISPLTAGDELRLGANVLLRVRRAEDASGAVPLVEEVDSGERHAFATDRLVLADAPNADVRVPGAGRGVTLLVERDGAVWRGEADALSQLAVDQEFSVGGRRFRLRHAPVEPGVTRDLLCPHELKPARYPYVLEARLDGPTGPEATLRDTNSGVSLVVGAENPALLLYLLARQHLLDRAAGAPSADRGWLGDAELAVGIWGRMEAERQGNNLNVLIWRVRRELQAGGLDPWCLEKRRKHTRVRLDDVTIR